MITPTRRQLQALRQRIHDAGGLVGRVDLAERWNVSEQRVAQLAAMPDFPPAVATIGKRSVWLRAECDAWRAARARS